MLEFLVKAGLDVAAGIESAVPDFAGWTGAIPGTEAALAGESPLNDINDINAKFPAASALEHRKCVEAAWEFLKDELEPQLLAGKMRQLFQLYKVQLKHGVGGHERQVAWLCNKCLAREKGKSTWAISDSVPQLVLENCYPDTNIKSGKRRGVAVLISMEKVRQGGAVDRGRLETLAHSLKLNYDGNNFLDYDADELKKELLDLAHDQNRILPDDDCLVCFVNAHGGTGKDGASFFTDCNGRRISLLTDVGEPFRNCLVGKPKIFFVNACRGGLKLQGMDDPVDGLGANEEQPIPSSWSEGIERRYVEQEADCLIVFSTSQHAASPRDKVYGTNFAYALMRAVNNHRDSKDVVTILALLTYNVVHMELEEKDDASGKVRVLRQCPVLISSLRKLVYWPNL